MKDIYKIETKKIKELCEMIENKEIYLKPNVNSDESDLTILDIEDNDDEQNTQRSTIWDGKKNESLIITIFDRRVVPAIILNFNDSKVDFKYSIVDGKQRLNSLWMYYKNKFAVKDITNIADANMKNMNYSSLDKNQKAAFDNYSIPLIIISERKINRLTKTFETLNTNSTKLKPQEIRHAVYHGDLTKFINKFYRNSEENPILIEAEKSGLFNKAKILNRSFDEFLIKLLRLWITKEILNDNKNELDNYYSSSSFQNSLIENNESLFFNLVKKTFEYYNLIASELPREIRKPVIIYILFYLSMNREIDLDAREETDIERMINTLDDLSRSNSGVDYTFMDEIKNQNQKTRRENMISDFRKSYSENEC